MGAEKPIGWAVKLNGQAESSGWMKDNEPATLSPLRFSLPVPPDGFGL
jgi:hypothetical protein